MCHLHSGSICRRHYNQTLHAGKIRLEYYLGRVTVILLHPQGTILLSGCQCKSKACPLKPMLLRCFFLLGMWQHNSNLSERHGNLQRRQSPLLVSFPITQFKIQNEQIFSEGFQKILFLSILAGLSHVKLELKSPFSSFTMCSIQTW